jgi:hypothetical protein
MASGERERERERERKLSRAITDDESEGVGIGGEKGIKYRYRLTPTVDIGGPTTPYPNHQEFLDRSYIRT